MLITALAPPRQGFGTGNDLSHSVPGYTLELREYHGGEVPGCALQPRTCAGRPMRAVIERNARAIHMTLNGIRCTLALQARHQNIQTRASDHPEPSIYNGMGCSLVLLVPKGGVGIGGDGD